MGRNRFVVPNVVRLELSDGDWVEVKERLTYGEQQSFASQGIGLSAGIFGGDTGAPMTLDMEKFNITRLFTWLVDWSFVDASDKRVKVTKDAIRHLDPATVEEIDAGLSAHIEAMEKNSPTPGEPTLESVSDKPATKRRSVSG